MTAAAARRSRRRAGSLLDSRCLAGRRGRAARPAGAALGASNTLNIRLVRNCVRHCSRRASVRLQDTAIACSAQRAMSQPWLGGAAPADSTGRASSAPHETQLPCSCTCDGCGGLVGAAARPAEHTWASSTPCVHAGALTATNRNLQGTSCILKGSTLLFARLLCVPEVCGAACENPSTVTEEPIK